MTDQKQELKDYVEKWYAVFPKGDAEAMSSLYTEDARLLLANLPKVVGASAIGDFLGSFPTHADMDCRYEVTDIDFLTDDIAVVTGSGWVESKPKAGGDAVHDASRFLMVMKKDSVSGKWRCHYDASQHTPDVAYKDRPA
ncbi:MAG: SgcJ/EcaC family oxidoreductase [Pseudomonadota bacterium]